MQYLRQNTQQYITVGPFIDKSDGITTKDDVTATNIAYVVTASTQDTNATTHASGTCSATSTNDYGLAAIGHAGLYDFRVAAAACNFVGTGKIGLIYATSYLPVWEDIIVLPANVWDALFGKDLLDVNFAQLLGAAPTEGAGGRLAAAFTKFFDKATPTGTINSLPDAVAGANNGLPTTNGTKLNQTADLTAGQSIACSDKTGFSLSATGADLILKSSTFIQAIVAAINEFATYGLTALNTLLVSTGIKALSIPNATVGGYAAGQDPATLVLVTPANKINTDAANAVKIQKMAVTLAPADCGGNLPAQVKAQDNIDFGALQKASITAAVPTASAISDQVWDEAIAGHAGAGSTGAALSSASSAGDPWNTPLPGGYGPGTAGKIVGDNLNAPVATVDTVVDAIKAKTDNLPAAPSSLDAAGVRAAIGMAAANLDAQIAALPTDADVNAACDAALADAVPSLPTAAQIADKILGRNIAGGADAGRTVTSALRALRNKVSLVAVPGSVVVYREDDATIDWQGPVTTDPAAAPITSVDPT